jgi:putative transposase
MMAKTKTPRKTLPTGIGKVLKRLHYPLDVILLCVRWYVAYSLSLRNLEEMMAERGIEVDHSSVHRWVIKLLPVFEKAFRNRKRPVGKSWRVDETYRQGQRPMEILVPCCRQDGKHGGFPAARPA